MEIIVLFQTFRGGNLAKQDMGELKIVDFNDSVNVAVKENRVVPRYPMAGLLFHVDSFSVNHALEILDLSKAGMQCRLPLSEGFSVGAEVSGKIKLTTGLVPVALKVMWIKNLAIGFKFLPSCKDSVQTLLKAVHVPALVSQLRSVLDIAGDRFRLLGLTTWLRSSGPLEIHLWKTSNNRIQKISCFYLCTLIEWDGTHGVRTATVNEFFSRADDLLDFDTLQKKYEVLFHANAEERAQKIALDCFLHLPTHLMNEEDLSFCQKCFS
jgi:hypothetical protein